MRPCVYFGAGVLAWLILSSGLLASPDPVQRHAKFDDLSAVEPKPHSFVFSPDGRALAFVRAYPKSALPPREQTSLSSSYGGDIWLQETPGEAAKNLTRGLGDASRWWGPRWSPDGRRLAFLSTRGDRIGVWVWERQTGNVRPLSPDSVAPREDPFRWLSPDEIVCFGPPEGEIVRARSLVGESIDRATSAWAKAAQGELTASALDSREFELPRRRLFVVNVKTGLSRAVAQTVSQAPFASFITRSWWLSPSGETVAVIAAPRSEYGFYVASKLGFPRTMELRTLKGAPVRLVRPLPGNVITDTVAWSPDGQELAFFAYGDTRLDPAVVFGRPAAAIMPGYVDHLPMRNPARLWRVHVGSGQVEQMPLGDIDPGHISAPDFRWTANGGLLFHAARRQNGATHSGEGQAVESSRARGWWVLGRDGRSRPLTTALEEMPEAIEVIESGRAALAVVKQDAWYIDIATGAVKNLTAAFGPSVIAARANFRDWHYKDEPVPVKHTRGVLTARVEPSDSLRDYIVEWASGTAVPVVRSTESATLMAFDPESESVVYLADGDEGTVLSRGTPAGQPDVLVRTNTGVREIATSERRRFRFVSSHGQELNAEIVLPGDYQAGRRYPTIAIVYLGRTLGRGPHRMHEAPTYLDAIAAAGYGVLRMEIPSNPPGLGDSPASMFMLSSAVMPALDEAIKMGLADPDRLFALGHSQGGWSVAALLVQTNRFRAAVGQAGGYDQLTNPRGPLPRSLVYRHMEGGPHQYVAPTGADGRASSREIPWWRELAEIRQNAPLAHADRIQTPLLLQHGDADPVALESAEDLFNALVSMRKRAQLVRYWGEAHDFETPANVRDAWQRVFAWFDDFGDIARDRRGDMVFEGGRVQSRKGAPPLTPADFATFGPAAPGGVTASTASPQAAVR